MEEETPAYPIPRPAPMGGEEANDTRFTLGLMVEIGKVLEKHGFPGIHTGKDYVRLQMAMFDFIYEKAHVIPFPEPPLVVLKDDVLSPIAVLNEIEMNRGLRKEPGA